MPTFSIPGGGGGSKTRYFLSLTSGTSWTVPAGVTRINVLLVGGGGGGAGIGTSTAGSGGSGGNTTFTGATTALGGAGGNGINAGGSYVSGVAGATAQANTGDFGLGGTLVFNLGVARGQEGVRGQEIASSIAVTPGASISYSIGAGGTSGSAGIQAPAGGTGGSGRIDIEYYI